MSRQEQKKAEARLIEAAGAGDAEGVKAALAAGARTEVSDASGRTPLLLASLGDHVAAARALVEAGADPDAQDDRDDSAWLVTGVTGSVEMMRTLLLYRAGPDPAEPVRRHRAHPGRRARARAVHPGRVAGGVDGGGPRQRPGVDRPAGGGDPRRRGADHQETVRLLLAAGATPDLADRDGVTPREHAERRGFDRMAELLRKAEAAG